MDPFPSCEHDYDRIDFAPVVLRHRYRPSIIPDVAAGGPRHFAAVSNDRTGFLIRSSLISVAQV